MGDGFQIKGFIKIKQYKKDGTVIRDEKVYNKVTDIGRQWFLHKGSSPILQNNLSNFGQSDFFSCMDNRYYSSGNSIYGYREVVEGYPRNYLFNIQQDLYDKHKAAGGAKNFIGDKTSIPTEVGYASLNANPKTIATSASSQGLVVDATNVPITDDFKVSQTWRYPEGCAVGTINAIAMLQMNCSDNIPTMGYTKSITPRILNSENDVGKIQAYIPPNIVYNRGQSDEFVWTKLNEIIVHTVNNFTFKIELDTGKCTELKPSDLRYNLDFIPTNAKAFINSTLYGVNKVLYVASTYDNIKIVTITDSTISVTDGHSTTRTTSGTNYSGSYYNSGYAPTSMFTKIVNGERHAFIIANYNSNQTDFEQYPNMFYASEWKLDGTFISLKTNAETIGKAINSVTGGTPSIAGKSLYGILDAGDGENYVAIIKNRFKHDYGIGYGSPGSSQSGNSDSYVWYGVLFTDLSDYDKSCTDRALVLELYDRSNGSSMQMYTFMLDGKLCSISYMPRGGTITDGKNVHAANRSNLSFSKEGWAGNLISMKLLPDPIIKGTDDILDITYGYEIGEKNDQ